MLKTLWEKIVVPESLTLNISFQNQTMDESFQENQELQGSNTEGIQENSAKDEDPPQDHKLDRVIQDQQNQNHGSLKEDQDQKQQSSHCNLDQGDVQDKEKNVVDEVDAKEQKQFDPAPSQHQLKVCFVDQNPAEDGPSPVNLHHLVSDEDLFQDQQSQTNLDRGEKLGPENRFFQLRRVVVVLCGHKCSSKVWPELLQLLWWFTSYYQNITLIVGSKFFISFGNVNWTWENKFEVFKKNKTRPHLTLSPNNDVPKQLNCSWDSISM